MTGWLIVLGILFLIAIFPLGASIIYDEQGLRIRLIAGPAKVLLYPRGNKSEKEEKQDRKKKEKPEMDQREEALPEGAPTKDLGKPEQGGSLLDFLPLVDVALDMLSALVGKLRVNFLQLRLTLAGEDPCDLAVNYGRAQAAGATLMAKLNEWLVIKKQDVQIQCDFTADEMKILARLDLTLTIGRAVSWAVVYGVRALITFLKIKKQREKGGAAL